MDERRKAHRLPINITMTIEELYNQNDKLDSSTKEVKVVDISKGGIAFESEKDFPLEYYFNSRVTIDHEKSFFTVIKIIRKNIIDKTFHYGGEFVGLANVLSDVVDEYEKEIEEC